MAPLYVDSIGLANWAILASISLTGYFVCLAIYRVLLHPLRAFPGPISHRVSNFPRAFQSTRGELGFHVADLHRKYGPVVRLGPNELAFSDPQAWKDIYGHRTPGQEEFPKYLKFYKPFDDMPSSVISADRNEHSALRRQLAHGFSERSMRGQEPIIGEYVDLLIQKLRANCEGGTKPLNMRNWLNWATFDIVGDLGFGSPFGCLDSSDYHPWVRLITDNIKQGALLNALQSVGGRPIVQFLKNQGLLKRRDQHQALVKEKLAQRMELGVERPDLIEGLIHKKEELGLDLGQLQMNASLLIIAGSETTATLLSGAVFLLTTNPSVLKTLTEEVRSAFSNDEEITLLSVGKLQYMLACLNETLRHYPPVGIGLPRQSPKGGAMVAGHFIPEGTVTAVWQWAINHDPNHWTKPMEFHPERFLNDPIFKGDKLDAMQPFSMGPRNCIGRNLAYAEMRLILAKIIYNFDMRIADESRGWLETQKMYGLWDKPPLEIFLSPIAH
ncbi:cytochrome P450 [Truncatella angustata]|uniref:Cytochrome P450 n=1 Tax=Truncatella angustata TaxID=152316 RepID=A0A9P8RJI1_9PEZI|nr:cytochrome P450 [Truncatella angustata]KAH6647193.1 cytochrome P450 [Truncatella angustata]